MEIRTVEECFKFRLLRKIAPDKVKSLKSVDLVNQQLKEAEEALNSPFLKFTITDSYLAMFHASRALLYLDGIQEKSHYAIFIYLKEKYYKEIPLSIINLLNIHRIERHEVMYGLDFTPNKAEAELALKDAKIFVDAVFDLLKKRRIEIKPKIVQLFEKVQKIPYRVCKFDEDKIDEALKEGDCRHKSTLLFNLLSKSGFDVKKIKVVFNWKDLPIPIEILSNLKESSTIWDHDALSVKIGERWIKIDCTWDGKLAKLGFPVTKNWDGRSDTLQVTNGKLSFFDSDNYIKDKRINIIKEEVYSFAEALNKWMEKGR